MKKSIFILVILISEFSLSLLAQSFPDPEYSSRPYYLESDSILKIFERADAKIDIKVKGIGYGGSELYYTAFKPKSSIRFVQNALPKFVIKVFGNVDLSDFLILSKAIVKKDRRRFLHYSMAFGGKIRDVSYTYIKLEFKKIRENIYQIILPNDIQPGEYAFMPIITDYSSAYKQKINCFGID